MLLPLFLTAVTGDEDDLDGSLLKVCIGVEIFESLQHGFAWWAPASSKEDTDVFRVFEDVSSALFSQSGLLLLSFGQTSLCNESVSKSIRDLGVDDVSWLDGEVLTIE